MRIQRILLSCICIVVVSLLSAGRLSAQISNQTLAVLVNENDPESLEIADYYKRARQIPERNIIYLSFSPNKNALTKNEFKKIELQLNEKVPEDIQAYALAWRKPWRVDCMSITSAFSLGFSSDYCSKSCSVTKPVEYFNSSSHQPYTDYKIRPSMLLSSNSLQGVKNLIDRGVQADYLRPLGAAYLLSTSDKNRNVRARYFPEIEKRFQKILKVEILKADAITNKKDILFYFTGRTHIKGIEKNNYYPGAIADHLTSSGGVLFGGSQMSILNWIDAGTTGSYGTVVEPCSYVQKFPAPIVVMRHYLSGDSLIEAYWKSVKMPGQGLFVGEPLATPFKGCHLVANRRGSFQYLNSYIENFVERKSGACNLF